MTMIVSGCGTISLFPSKICCRMVSKKTWKNGCTSTIMMMKRQPPLVLQFRTGGAMQCLVVRSASSTSHQEHDKRNKQQYQEQQYQEQQEQEKRIQEHYYNPAKHGDLWQRIQQGLAVMAKNNSDNDTNPILTLADLAVLDEFHSRGRQGTLDLLQMVQRRQQQSQQQTPMQQQQQRILDVGCGLGGTARQVAQTYKNANAHVTGIDITAEYIHVGQALTRLLLQQDKVTLIQGSALNLPFGNASFDLILTVHVQMNISNKKEYYNELARVLKPGGIVAFHDVLSSSSPQEEADENLVAYPCPWAETRDISHLATTEEMQGDVTRAGFEIVQWEDHTEKTIQFFQSSVTKMTQRDPPPLGVHLLMGDKAAIKIQNHLRNCQHGRTIVIMGLLSQATRINEEKDGDD